MKDTEAREKKELLKEALKVVNELGKFTDDRDYWEGDDTEKIEELIRKARKLKKSRWWDVPKK